MRGFWIAMWQEGKTGFDQSSPNPFLCRFFDRLKLMPQSRIFVPLCGRSVDVLWLIEQGFNVVAVELYEPAVQELFERLNVVPKIAKAGQFAHYHAPSLEVYVGDFFALDQEEIGVVDGVYDRAALVAFPKKLRKRYVKHLEKLAPSAKVLLISIEYDPPYGSNPPFCVPKEEIKVLYGSSYEVRCLERASIVSSKRSNAYDAVYYLEPKGCE